MMINFDRIYLDTNLPEPKTYDEVRPVLLSDQTMEERYQKIIAGMKERKLDYLVIYADKEHSGNFEYLTGFIPRFEEALLILKQDHIVYYLLGNENLKMSQYTRLPGDVIHVPFFSLPNQPMESDITLVSVFERQGLNQANRVGLVGWKLFSGIENEGGPFDIPYYIVEALKKSVRPAADLVNSNDLFIGPDKGARITNNANEIAHYEYGANLSSNCILNALNAIEVGKEEIEIGKYLTADGQVNTVVPIAATGERFQQANLYPTAKKIQRGDAFSVTTGFKGGLSSRTGLVVSNEAELPRSQKDYLERVVYPYYNAVVAWLENLRINKSGKEIYQVIETVLPKEQYGWSLNPGHLTADEEWMSSPIYPGSENRIQSGMIFQIDIIPSIPGYTGVSAEDCIAIADEALRTRIKEEYPDLWKRILHRRVYIVQTLNISLPDEILPLSNTVGYLRPFLLNKSAAICCNKS
ncbi:M24 family metallopeptidase [Lacrimispora sp.]|uniref:M24 family metallopeptidase n=1 Tax=Lacrimispora sp. TaxID=2719234 RepID=UPI0028AABFD0|nr:M24 family metallopeptidase [Lacrimispora sp.]